MTRWRVVKAPVSRYQDGPRYAALSDRPGPVVGARGGLHGWEVQFPPTIEWMDFEEACLLAARLNGKPSTANMGPQSAAEGGDS